MRNPTKREQAEAIVAMVRAEYPNPRRNTHEDVQAANREAPHGRWYCVGGAVHLFSKSHPGVVPKKVDPFMAAELNNAGDFEGAWDFVTDQIEAAL